ncbi:MAG: hypothetical protein HYX39_14290 [Bacteroidetes bacterium]|nr:hypothetical protein [Bacteroidota bacterium]
MNNKRKISAPVSPLNISAIGTYNGGFSDSFSYTAAASSAVNSKKCVTSNNCGEGKNCLKCGGS